MNLRKQLTTICTNACNELWPEIAANSNNFIEITHATKKEFGHYQCNSAMRLAKELKLKPRDIAQSLVTKVSQLEPDMFQDITIAGPGFINFTLKLDFLSELATKQLQDSRLNISGVESKQKVVIDFSSPNIAKEMHVGHLRSTIIGDCIARTLEFLGFEVLRINHIGDWGTQFGMLIAYLKQQKLLTSLATINLKTLVNYYKASKSAFDANPEFKKQAQLEVVALQQGNSQSLDIWQQLCNISLQNYTEIYELLDIKLITRGESFYNPVLATTVADLEQQGLVTISDGAKCIYLTGFTNRDGDPLPLIVEKSDGGYNYATTDLAAIRQRAQEEKGNWLIYVTDAGQAQHFAMVFAAAAQAKYVTPEIRLDHVPFGLVLKPDGKKFKTREGDTESLQDLIATAIAKAKDLLLTRDSSISDINTTATILGINAIKYADLCNHRSSNYVFSYDKMLQFEGNTAAFLAYAYVRIKSIKDKAATGITTAKIVITEPAEINLILLAVQLPEVCEQFVVDLLPHRLCEYLYKLAEAFHSFFHHCKVVGSVEQDSRLALCQLIENIMELGFALLGLKTLTRM